MLKDNLSKLRFSEKLSQAAFSEILGVSQQTVQKWESGAAVPTMDKLIVISKKFGISLDALILNNNARATEEMKYNKKILPYYEGIHKWELYSLNISEEYKNAIDEGLDVSAYKDLFAAAEKMPCSEYKEQVTDILFNILLNAPQLKDYKYEEPSTLEEIKVLRKPYEFKSKMPEKSVLKDKIYGAWMGRVCGCMFGKSVEGIKSKELEKFLKLTNNYPVSRYMLRSDFTDEQVKDLGYPLSTRPFVDTCNCMIPDDDTNYTILYQELIKVFGRDFTPTDVMTMWVEKQPKSAYCTAERVGFCNFIKGYNPPYTATYKNPYREWIGAQIRGDYFGYINPGNPEMAAEMAFRDACCTHTKNGIYGEMFISAMLAVAAVSDNIKDIIYGGLAQIPYTSRLYEKITALVDLFNNGASKKECFDFIKENYSENTNWCETIPNAMIVVASLLCGKEDYGKSICMSIEIGFDTDCNAATVGSILGMKNGISSIPAQWTDPIHDTLETTLFGVGTVKISDRAEMTLKDIK